MGLHDEHVVAAHGLTEAAADFAVRELDQVVGAEFDVQVGRHLLRQCGMRPARVERKPFGGDLFHDDRSPIGGLIDGRHRGQPAGAV